MLKHPFTRSADVRPLLLKMARRLGGDPELTDPASALIACPGTHCTRVYPSEPVSVLVWESERRYDMNTINAAMEG